MIYCQGNGVFFGGTRIFFYLGTIDGNFKAHSSEQFIISKKHTRLNTHTKTPVVIKMAIIDMGDLEQAVILEAQNHETTEAVKDLETELLDWNDWRVAKEAIQEDDDIQKCVQY